MVTDMRNMRLLVLQIMAQLLNSIEESGLWPTKLTKGYIPLIPKGKGSAPLQLRPLSVLSVMYGAWLGIPLHGCLRWQENWVHRNAYTFGTSTHASEAAILFAVLIARAHML